MFDIVKKLFDLKHLNENFLIPYGNLTYGILFFIIFAETGLVVTPFLPGDSLLFAVGAIAAWENPPLNLWALIFLLSTAAFVGNMVNYRIGRFVGPRFLEKEKIPLIKKSHIIKTQAFYEKYGATAVILSRFVPILRTFVPFVAGISGMDWKKFTFYTFVGAIGWVGIATFAGYLFGNIPWVRDHFETVVLAIIFISLLPAIVGVLSEYFKKEK